MAIVTTCDDFICSLAHFVSTTNYRLMSHGASSGTKRHGDTCGIHTPQGNDEDINAVEVKE